MTETPPHTSATPEVADDVLTAGVVMRLPARRFDTTEFSPDEILHPDAGDFALSTEEKKRVDEVDGIGAISVWDRARTTPEQAAAILPKKSRLILDLRVEDILGTKLSLKVLRTKSNSALPGNDGHCDIQDIWQGSRGKAQQIRSALAAKAKVVGKIAISPG